MRTECCHKTVLARCAGCPYSNPRYSAALDVVRYAQVIDNLLTGPHKAFSMDDLWNDIELLRAALAVYNRINLNS